MRLTDQAQARIAKILHPGDLAVDATAGNGHDTLFLATCVGPSGQVWAFDVQQSALDATRNRLLEAGSTAKVFLSNTGHEAMVTALPASAQGTVKAIMFNLGYLPGSDKSIQTQTATTLAALDQATRLLAPGGLVSIMLYPGHPGGDEESLAVKAWADQLSDIFSTEYIETGKAKSPELILLSKHPS